MVLQDVGQESPECGGQRRALDLGRVQFGKPSVRERVGYSFVEVAVEAGKGRVAL